MEYSFENNAKLVISENISFETFDDNETIILDTIKSKTHLLNSTATMIFNIIRNGKLSIIDCLNEFSSMFETAQLSEYEIKNDARDIINEMIKVGIIHEN